MMIRWLVVIAAGVAFLVSSVVGDVRWILGFLVGAGAALACESIADGRRHD